LLHFDRVNVLNWSLKLQIRIRLKFCNLSLYENPMLKM
jgi:hypothetical protein